VRVSHVAASVQVRAQLAGAISGITQDR
jgi:hypothetical protein